jgi:hypothetical protein
VLRDKGVMAEKADMQKENLPLFLDKCITYMWEDKLVTMEEELDMLLFQLMEVALLTSGWEELLWQTE